MVYTMVDLANTPNFILKSFNKLGILLAHQGYILRIGEELECESIMKIGYDHTEVDFILCYTSFNDEIRKNHSVYKVCKQYNIPLFDRGDYFSNTLFIEDVMTYAKSHT